MPVNSHFWGYLEKCFFFFFLWQLLLKLFLCWILLILYKLSIGINRICSTFQSNYANVVQNDVVLILHIEGTIYISPSVVIYSDTWMYFLIISMSSSFFDYLDFCLNLNKYIVYINATTTFLRCSKSLIFYLLDVLAMNVMQIVWTPKITAFWSWYIQVKFESFPVKCLNIDKIVCVVHWEMYLFLNCPKGTKHWSDKQRKTHGLNSLNRLQNIYSNNAVVPEGMKYKVDTAECSTQKVNWGNGVGHLNPAV